MRQSQENITSMWAVATATLVKNQAIWTTSAPVTDTLAAIVATNANVATALNRQQQATKAYTLHKEEAKREAIAAAVIAATNVEAYAAISQNTLLKQQIHSTATVMLSLPDTELTPKLQNIHDIAVQQLPNMSAYHNTLVSLADLQTKIDNYQAALSGPSEIIAEIKTATTQIETFIAQGQAQFRIMDMLILNYKVPQPQFYSDYRNARKIKNLGTQKTKLQLFVELEDGVDAALIPVIIALPSGRTYTETTDTDGNVTFSGIPRGYYTLTINHAGYQPYEKQNIKIQTGKTTSLDVTLMR